MLMGRYPHAGRWFESDDDRAWRRRRCGRCGCLEFADRRWRHSAAANGSACSSRPVWPSSRALLLLDEPATFLDIDQQLQCFSVLREEADRGVACIAVTHDLNLALGLLHAPDRSGGRGWPTTCSAAAAIADAGLAARRSPTRLTPRHRPAGGRGCATGDAAVASVGRGLAGRVGGVVLAAAVLLPLVGPSALDWSASGSARSPTGRSYQLRLSRTLLGLFAGGALALAGSLFQSMLRDALATPYTLGVSTGASLGAVIAIAFGWHTVPASLGIWAGALAGAGVVLVRRDGRGDA